MKKKIKDLTLQEIKEICFYSHCLSCPFNRAYCYGVLQTILNVDMEKEIEVEKKNGSRCEK